MCERYGLQLATVDTLGKAKEVYEAGKTKGKTNSHLIVRVMKPKIKRLWLLDLCQRYRPGLWRLQVVGQGHENPP